MYILRLSVRYWFTSSFVVDTYLVSIMRFMNTRQNFMGNLTGRCSSFVIYISFYVNVLQSCLTVSLSVSGSRHRRHQKAALRHSGLRVHLLWNRKGRHVTARRHCLLTSSVSQSWTEKSKETSIDLCLKCSDAIQPIGD